jgi:hypothetical protein
VELAEQEEEAAEEQPFAHDAEDQEFHLNGFPQLEGRFGF